MNTSKSSKNIDDFILQEFIGSGGFGKVYKVKDKQINKIYAAKISINAIDESSQSLFIDISHEVDIMSRLNHPGFLKFIFYSPINFKRKPKPVIITEYASNGSLLRILEHDQINPTERILDDTRKLIIIYGIVAAMAYLHSHGILHRDLKPDNVLLDDYLFPKIADFGLSKNDKLFEGSMIIKTANNTIKGTPIYISPEIWSKNEYSKSSDVYAFSIVLFQIMTCQKPFPNSNIFNLGLMVKKGDRPEIKVEIPEAYKDLIFRCWSQEPQERPTFDQILKELRNDRKYITEKVNEQQYLNFIRYIEEQETSFNSNKTIIETKSFIIYKYQFLNNSEVSDENVGLINDYCNHCTHFPYKYYKNLSKESQLIVIESEDQTSLKSANKLFEVGRNLIEGRQDFPIDVKIGLDFIKKSIDKGSQIALIYYINMLIKGKFIPSNHKRALKLIETRLSNDESTYFLMKGKLFKNEGRYSESADFLKRSIEKGNDESLYEYAKLLQKTKPNEDIDKFYIEAIEHCHSKSMLKYGRILQMNENNKYEPEKQEEGLSLIKEAISKGNVKANYYYGLILESQEVENINPDESESFKYFKRSAELGHVESMNKVGVRLFNYIESLPKLGSFDNSAYYLKKSSAKGCFQSMFYLGYILVYYNKKDPTKVKEGTRLFKISADNGYADAMGEYATSLCDGKGVEVDCKEAIKYYKKGIANGSAISMNDYAIMLKNGVGVEVDYEGAIKYYKMAIDKGHLLAMSNYAAMFKNGIGVKKDCKKALKYYKMAADKGCSSAMHNYAFMLLNGIGVEIDYKEALKYFKMAADKGRSAAMNNYAHMLLSGQGVEVDYEGAIKYFKMAIDDDDLSASHNHYGYMLEHGLGLEINIEEAIKHYKIAIDKGNYPLALTNYANILYNGKGVEKNEEEGIKLYKEAISKNEPVALLTYGMILFNNKNESQEEKELGLSYIIKSVNKGNAKALYEYGRLLEEGQIESTDKNEFIQYYEKASKKGNKEAEKALQRIRKETPK